MVDKDDELVGFAVVMPAFAKALQKTNGKLFPFGFRHILRAKKHSKDVIFYLIGILPEYQNKGIGAQILEELQSLQPNKPLRLRCFQVNKRALK